jgi:hypothetical protein
VRVLSGAFGSIGSVALNQDAGNATIGIGEAFQIFLHFESRTGQQLNAQVSSFLLWSVD